MKSFTTIIISHVVFLAIFGVAAYALAQEEATLEPVADQEVVREERQAARESAQTERAETQQERMTDREAAQAERQIERETVREERRATLEARAQERITNLAANLSNRLEAAIARLEQVIDRMETRIEKLNAAGVDTTVANEALNRAQRAVDAAAVEIAGIDEAVYNTVTSEDVRAGWQTLRSQFQSIRDLIREAHTELRASLAALKSAINETRANPDTAETPQSETTETE